MCGSGAPSGARPTPSTRRGTSPTTPTCGRPSGTDGALATLHYIRSGFAEGRDDSPPPPDEFDGLQYIASHADLVGALGANPDAGLRHYQRFGRAEGRAADTFDEAQYLANYPDLATVFAGDGAAATRHYILFGRAEGRTAAEAGNMPPTVVDDAFTATEDDASAPLDLLANDGDLDAGDALEVAGVSAAARGCLAGAGRHGFLRPGRRLRRPGRGRDRRRQLPLHGRRRRRRPGHRHGRGDRHRRQRPAGVRRAPSVAVVENTAAVPVTVTDPEEDPLTLAVTGGADAALFTIDAVGQLVFAAAPDHEGPVDAEGDNVYLVQVTAGDGAGATDLRDLTVTVVNDPADDDPADSENSGSEGDMGMAVLDFLM